MVIKANIKSLLIISLIFSITLVNSFNFKIIYTNENNLESQESLIDINRIYSSGNDSDEWPKTYPDKVYTFLTPHSNKIFILEFRKYHYYTINLELVTPNECNISMEMTAPSGLLYKIYNETLYFIPDKGRYDFCRFGTAENGNFTLRIDVMTDYNVNIYINIKEEEKKCLYDKLPGYNDYDNKTIGYDVYALDRGSEEPLLFKAKEYLVNLESDTMYRILMQRVTSISKRESRLIYINMTLKDPNTNQFIIYPYYEFLKEDFEELDILFGTALAGSYKLTFGFVYMHNITFNFAYIMYRHREIGESINETQAEIINEPINETETDNGTTANTTFYFQIPQEAYIVIPILAGMVIITIIVAFQYSRKNLKAIDKKQRKNTLKS